MAIRIKEICGAEGIPFIFKASFDKANRSSPLSYRGPGLAQGIEILEGIRSSLGIPVITDYHESWQAGLIASSIDVLQVPALLSRQSDIIQAGAKTAKPLNIKKGQWMSPDDMFQVVAKALAYGASDLIITERGSSFGYQNLVVDFRSIPKMKPWGFPVVIDASHSIQIPGGKGASSGGERDLIPTIALAGIAAGADGIFIETHDQPDLALSDGPNSLDLKDLPGLIKKAKRVYEAIRATVTIGVAPIFSCSITTSRVRGLIQGSSPWRLTIRSASVWSEASATRSVPVRHL